MMDATTMEYSELRFLVLSDLYRYKNGRGGFLHEYLFSPSFRYIFWFRFCKYLMKKGRIANFLALLARITLKRMSIRLGIDISLSVT